jgi:hypothetical protein
MSGRCAEVQEREWCKRVGSGRSELTRIADGRRRRLQSDELLCEQPGGRERGKRFQAREEIGAPFIGMESRRIWQEVDGIEEGVAPMRTAITRRDFARGRRR